MGDARAVAEWAGCPVEVAEFDVPNAFSVGDAWPGSIVATRIGEAFGDWRQPRPLS
jgi:hypothetical protein